MPSAVAGYKATPGADAPRETPSPLKGEGRGEGGSHRPKLFVVDPRIADTARDADLHLAILPGTDVALFNGLLHVMLWEGLVDHAYIAAHSKGFDALKERVRAYTPERVAGLDDPLAAPLQDGGERGKVACNCLNASAAEIEQAIAQGADLAGVRAKLKCGSECGSCAPELKPMPAG